MANEEVEQKKEEPEPPKDRNPIVDESRRIQISQILENFLASEDEVYDFEANLSSEERVAVSELSQKMGLNCRASGHGINRKISAYKIKKKVDNTNLLESLPHYTVSEELKQVVMANERVKQKKEEPEPPQHQNPIVNESKRIQISQILEKFLASENEVCFFEANLSSEERVAVTQLSQKMGLTCRASGRGIKRKVSVYKFKRKVDTTNVLENLPHFSSSEESKQDVMANKRQKKEELEPPQLQNPIADGSSRIWISKILKKFLASKDQVYNFKANLSVKQRAVLRELSHKMGLCCRAVGCKRKCSVHKPEPSKFQDHIVDQSRIQILHILEEFLASKDQVYKVEDKLSLKECAVWDQLSQKMGLCCRRSRCEKKWKISVYKVKEKVDTATVLESLPHFIFSEESKQLLGGLFMHYPPGEEKFCGEMIGMNGVTTDKTKQKKDNIFGRPSTSKAEVAKKLEDFASRMKDPSDLKPIIEERSKLPIASFKDVITSTVESHQVVLISGETGCGKTTQVPQFILDHMWSKGEVCKVVCTQPRRISAISVSERISSERGETIGENIGYKIRLESRGGRKSSIVLCTTGVLLRVLVSKGSSWLKTRSVKDGISGITHIIMDEIHERDRYSDLMMAILREMLPSYPHLRLILMSATVDSVRFSQYFGGCPIIHVPGFTYPVKTYYLEDVLSIVKSTKDSHLEYTAHELSQEGKLSLDEAINLAWSNDEWDQLLELVCSEGTPKVFDYQHSLTGLTPLMVFAGKGKTGDMCMLLSLGANCHITAKDGTTALEIAGRENQQEAAKILEKHMDNDISNEEGKKLLDKYLATVNPELVDIVLIEQLIRKICNDSNDGGILVFLPGWDEINRTREKLLASPFFNDTAKFTVLPLHSMVPPMDQQKVFMRPPHGCRKIVISTNIAETAVTIDDIVYVIDSGWMKEKSYDPYNNVTTLQSTWVSKASAKQREGRAGRCQPGICYHLYSKGRAVSLPDFQDPEIRRMPIEELCLQVKLLDPSGKIEVFLRKTLDPPVFESIHNAVVILQEIGALTLDEELTQLGEKLGSLPVHPSTSRMLFFAILMNCLDPALTLACASDYRDPFTLPMLPDEKKKAAVAKSELAALYGGCGDQFAVIAAFECWENAKRMDLEARFCSQYFVSPSTMQMISGMRKKLTTELIQNGLIHQDVSSYSLNAHDPGILHAVLVAGLYPMVGKLRLTSRKEKGVFVETEKGDKVRLNSNSTNFKLSSQKNFDRSLVAYDEITLRDSGMVIRNCTVIGPLPVLLLSTRIAVAPAKAGKEGDEFMSSPDNIVKVITDQWLEFESKALDVSWIYCLRERLSAAIYEMTHSADVLPPNLAVAMDAIACILSCDGLSGMPQILDNADTPTTKENANSGKPARGTEQVGKNPDRSCKKLKNHNTLQTDVPSSKVSVSASNAIENPSGLTRENAPIGSACSISTEMVKPEGSHTELKNHDAHRTNVPSSSVSVSASKGIENPTDSKSHNGLRGSACSIPTTEQMAKNPEGSHMDLENQATPQTNIISLEVHISVLKGTENPSDPTSQNALIGAACSIQNQNSPSHDIGSNGSQCQHVNSLRRHNENLPGC